jgi:hypothetical protein
MNLRITLRRAKDFLESLRLQFAAKRDSRHINTIKSILDELDLAETLLNEAKADNPRILAYVNMPDRDYPGNDDGVYRIIGVRIELNEFHNWCKSNHPYLYLPIEWLKSRIEAGSMLMTFSASQATCILKLRDAILKKDFDEAWNWLKTLDSKQVPHDPFQPWVDLERIAEQGKLDDTKIPR